MGRHWVEDFVRASGFIRVEGRGQTGMGRLSKLSSPCEQGVAQGIVTEAVSRSLTPLTQRMFWGTPTEFSKATICCGGKGLGSRL